jgi:hypothetical protein
MMLDLKSTNIVWNVTLGIQVVALFIWDQKWGVLVGGALGCLLGYSLHG